MNILSLIAADPNIDLRFRRVFAPRIADEHETERPEQEPAADDDRAGEQQ